MLSSPIFSYFGTTKDCLSQPPLQLDWDHGGVLANGMWIEVIYPLTNLFLKIPYDPLCTQFSSISQLNADNLAEDSKKSLEDSSTIRQPQDRRSCNLPITCEGSNLNTRKIIVTCKRKKLYFVSHWDFGVICYNQCFLPWQIYWHFGDCDG